MNNETARISIQNLLNDNWTATKIIFDSFTEPPREVDWIRISILNAINSRASLGRSANYRNVGTVIIEIYVLMKNGAGLAVRYGDTISGIFRGVTTSDGIIFRAPTVRDIGRSSGWYQVNVEIPFQWDNIF